MGWASFPRENSKATFSLSLSLWESFLSTYGFCIPGSEAFLPIGTTRLRRWYNAVTVLIM